MRARIAPGQRPECIKRVPRVPTDGSKALLEQVFDLVLIRVSHKTSKLTFCEARIRLGTISQD